MRVIYQTRYKQNQLVGNRRQQMALQSLPIPYNRYDAKGRNLHVESIAIGLAFWFFSFASIMWLNNETKKRKKSITPIVLRYMIHAKQALA